MKLRLARSSSYGAPSDAGRIIRCTHVLVSSVGDTKVGLCRYNDDFSKPPRYLHSLEDTCHSLSKFTIPLVRCRQLAEGPHGSASGLTWVQVQALFLPIHIELHSLPSVKCQAGALQNEILTPLISLSPILWAKYNDQVKPMHKEPRAG